MVEIVETRDKREKRKEKREKREERREKKQNSPSYCEASTPASFCDKILVPSSDFAAGKILIRTVQHGTFGCFSKFVTDHSCF